MSKRALAYALVSLPALVQAYPNGTLLYVTDLVPACASCHATPKVTSMPDAPAAMAQAELIENKHFGLVRSSQPPSPYAELTPEQKEAIINTAQLIDDNASIKLEVSGRVKAGGEVRATVRVTGGNGPVIGVMLVDRPLRFQARPAAAAGWSVLNEPEIKGQDGKRQMNWLDRRHGGGARNLNFVLIEDQKFDPAKKLFPGGEVVFTLRAPPEKGPYSLTGVLLYGTENASTAAVIQRPSGRILFSDEVKITVD